MRAFLLTNTVSETKKKEFITSVHNFYVRFLDELFDRFPSDNDGKLLKNLITVVEKFNDRRHHTGRKFMFHDPPPA